MIRLCLATRTENILKSLLNSSTSVLLLKIPKKLPVAPALTSRPPSISKQPVNVPFALVETGTEVEFVVARG